MEQPQTSPATDSPPVTDPVSYIAETQRDAQLRGIQGLDANPDEAARAHELSEATGVPSPLIHGDLENFEANHKAQLAAGLIQQNGFLQDYINSHPMAAKVSNDDWGNLDEFTDKLHMHQSLSALVQDAKKAPEQLGQYVWASWLAAGKGELQSLGEDFPGAPKGGPTIGSDLARIARLPKALVDMTVGALSVPFAPALNPAIEGASEATAQATQWTEGLLSKVLPGSLPSEDVEKIRSELEPRIANALFAMRGAGGEIKPEHTQALEQVNRAVDEAKPWIQSNQRPPPGINPLIDQGYAKLAESDLESFEAAQKVAQGSTTRARSPELFQKAGEAVTYGKMGISADAIRALYGDKDPKPDDNLLGWIPDLKEQLEAAEKYGGDVEVSKALWLAKAEPEVAKELREHLRLRPNGLTLAETQAAAEKVQPGFEPAQEAGEPVQLERQVEGAEKIGPFDELPQESSFLDELKANLARSDEITKQRFEAREAIKEENSRKLFDEGIPEEESLGMIREAIARSEKGGTQRGDKPGSAQYEALAQTLALKHGYVASLGEWDDFVARLKEEGEPQRLAAEERPPEGTLAFPTSLEGKRRLAQAEERHFEEQLVNKYGERPRWGELTKDEQRIYSDRVDRVQRAHDEWTKSQNTVDLREETKPLEGYDKAAYEQEFKRWERNERKKFIKPVEEPKAATELQSATDSIRKLSGLEDPLFAKELERPGRVHLEKQNEMEYSGVKTHEYLITDENGKWIGNLDISEEDGGKRLYVDNIGAGPQSPEVTRARGTPGSLGPFAVRDLLKQLAEEFPKAVERDAQGKVTKINISGTRVTGARQRAFEEGREPKAFISKQVKPAKELTIEDLQDLFEDERKGWVVPEDAPTGRDTIRGKGGDAQVLYTTKLRDILPRLDTGFMDQGERSIHSFFAGKLAQIVGDEPVQVISAQDMRKLWPEKPNIPGLYDINAGYILSDNVVKRRYAPEDVTAVVMHEADHAFTFKVMKEVPKIRENAKRLMEETKQHFGATDPDLIQRYSYAFSDKDAYEFVAEVRSRPDLQRELVEMPVSKETAKEFGINERTGTAWDAFKGLIKQIWGKLWGDQPPDTSMFDAYLKWSEGVEKQYREMKENPAPWEGPRRLGAEERPSAEGELSGRPERLRNFERGSAVGMTQAQFNRYQRLLDQRKVEDTEAQAKRVADEAKQRLTPEWKANEAKVREEAEAQIRNRGDILADNFIRKWQEEGEKVDLNPDELASAFGFETGEQMNEALTRLHNLRAGADPEEFIKGLVDYVTESRMKERFGDLDQNVIEAAKDQTLSETQLGLLHEDLKALGQKINLEEGRGITLADMKRYAKEQFDSVAIGSHSSDKYLRLAGKADKTLQEALAKGDFETAFKAKQSQLLSTLLAKEARGLEKQRTQFAKFAKRFSSREVGGVAPEYTNWIHDILMRTGNSVRRSVQDLQDAIGRESSDSLEKFSQEKNNNTSIWEQNEDGPSNFQIMPVAPFLFDQAYRKPIAEMTPAEFTAVHNSLKTLAKNGRDENKIIVGGERADLKDTIAQMNQQIGEVFKNKKFDEADTKGFKHIAKTYLASLAQVESLMNRLDRGDPKGLFKKAVSTPIFEGQNELSRLERTYSKLYIDLPAFGDLKKKIEPIFGDPLNDWDPMPMDRGKMLAVLQNVGNPVQLDKLVRGYMRPDAQGKLDKAQIEAGKQQVMQWLFKNTTKEDWERAQAMGDIFEKAFDESAQMYHGLSGVAPEKIPLSPIQTPFGEYKGWYHPLIYDPLRPGTSKKLMGQDPLEAGSYYKPVPPSGYTKRRTGYAAPILLNFESIPFRLKQMLNDIAMRPPVTEVSKVFHNRQFQMAMTRGYGAEIKDLLLPYLKDVANQKQYKTAAQSVGMRVLDYLRQNLTTVLIGLNPTTVMKHAPTAAGLSIKEVGVGPFMRELTGLLSHSDELGEQNWKFAKENSDELQRRERNWEETLSGAQKDLFKESGPSAALERLKQGKIGAATMSMRDTMIKFAAKPVAISDMLSAVPTWLARYKEQIRDGAEHGDAVQAANLAVRRAHGSSAVAARSAWMRGSPLAQMATPFYTFFNEMLQRQYEMVWRAKDTLGAFKEGDYEAGKAQLPGLASSLFFTVLFPAIVEQAVSPVLTGNQPAGVKAAVWASRTVMSALPIVRDIFEGVVGGRDPSVGLYGTAPKIAHDMMSDLLKGRQAYDNSHAGATIKHFLTILGLMTGLTNAQMGRTAEFAYDYATGKQRPKNADEIFKGLWHGKIKEQAR